MPRGISKIGINKGWFLKGNPSSRKGKITTLKTHCFVCTKEFVFRPYSGRIRKYCSRQCFGRDPIEVSKRAFGMIGHKVSDEFRKKISGVNNYNWKGGITSENSKARVLFRNTMQKLIFERDGYKCQICDATGSLQVDHIQSWSEFKELRFDPENCRTLCMKCHYKITFNREIPENVRTWGHNMKIGGI